MARSRSPPFKSGDLRLNESLPPSMAGVVSKGIVRWPRKLTPPLLIQILRRQKNPVIAHQIFTSVPDVLRTAPVYSTMLDRLLLVYPPNSLQIKTLIYDMIHMPSYASPSSYSWCRCPDWMFEKVIGKLVDEGNCDEAVEVYREIPNSNCVDWTRSFERLLWGLLENGKLLEAVKLFVDESRSGNCGGVKWKVGMFNFAIQTLCRMKRSDLAVQVFVEMQEHSCCLPDSETYRSVMMGLCESGRLEDATHLLYSMLRRISQKGCDVDVVVYRMLLEALCVNGMVEKAEEVLGKVLKKGLRIPRLRRTFQRWEITKGNLQEMKSSINEALATGGVRSATSYSAIIADLYSDGKTSDADRLMDEMVRQRGFKPELNTYKAKILALCKEGRSMDSVKVLEEEMAAAGCWPTVSTYNLVMYGLCTTTDGQATIALSVLKRMERSGNCVPSRETFEIVVDGLCCESRFVEASMVMERMLNKGHLPSDIVYSRLINGLSSIGRIYEAVVFLEEMVSQGKSPGLHVWTSLVSMTCNICWNRKVDVLFGFG